MAKARDAALAVSAALLAAASASKDWAALFQERAVVAIRGREQAVDVAFCRTIPKLILAA